jgi:hypothetical protein
MSTLYRAQLLLEPGQREALADIARREGRSISDLVREIISQHLAAREEEIQKQKELSALEELRRIRTKIREEHGVYQGDLLDQVRSECEEELERIWRGES